MNLTKKQLAILDFIYDFKSKNRICPTLVEIAEQMNTSSVTVFEHLRALETKNVIRKDRHMARSIEIIDPTYLKEKEKSSDVSILNDMLHSFRARVGTDDIRKWAKLCEENTLDPISDESIMLSHVARLLVFRKLV